MAETIHKMWLQDKDGTKIAPKTTLDQVVMSDGTKFENQLEQSLAGKQDTLVAGSNITLTPDETTDKITITAKDTTYSAATTSAAGLMSASDKTKLDGISTGANKYSHPNSGVTAGTYKSVTVNAAGHVTAGTNPTTISGYGITDALNSSLKGASNGLAELDENGKVPSSQLPSYVDDVLEYTNKASFPTTGETGKIYVDKTTNLTWRWSGTAYVEISPSLALGETSSTAYRGDRGKTAYDHSQSTHARTDATKTEASTTNGNIKINGTETTVYTHPGSGTNPHGTTKSDVGLGNVGNFKAVSTVASQGLTDTEKSNARANIGAGTSSLAIGTTSTTAAAGNHTHSSYVNQNAFSNVVVGETTVAADTATDTLTLVAGNNVTLTPDATNDKITITAKDTTYSAATTSAAGLMSASDKTKLDGITTGANKYSLPTASSTTLGGVKVGTNLSISDGVLSATDTTYSAATTSDAGLMSAADKTKLDGITTGANKYSLPTASASTLGGVKVGTNLSISGGVLSATDTTYSSKAAASGGTDVSLVTTGEKYTWNNKGTYSKPSGGIPKTDLASAVQTSLGKANSALQSYTETDPVFLASAASGITSSDISNWNAKTSNTGTVTSVAVKMNNTVKGTVTSSGTIDLGTVITSHQDISGKQDKLTAGDNITIANNVISATGGTEFYNITQADYDALPSSKLTDGVAYVITDADDMDAYNMPYKNTTVGDKIDNINFIAQSLMPTLPLTSIQTTYNTYDGRKFSAYKFIVITWGASYTDFRRTITIPTHLITNGMTINESCLHGTSASTPSSYNVTTLYIQILSDTSFLANVGGNGAVKYISITGYKLS